VNHKNGIKDDNRLCNIEWVSEEENVAHAVGIGIRARGSKIAGAKLDNSSVMRIRELLEAGVLLQREIADKFGVSRSTIGSIKRRRIWAWLK